MDKYGQNTEGIDETRFRREIKIWDGEGPRLAIVSHDGETVTVQVGDCSVVVGLCGDQVDVNLHKGEAEGECDEPSMRMVLASCLPTVLGGRAH